MSMQGKRNVAWGFVFLGLFMAAGFFLGYMHDIAPQKEQWIAQYASGTHFEIRVAHAHGALFGLINVAVGLALSAADSADSGALDLVARARRSPDADRRAAARAVRGAAAAGLSRRRSDDRRNAVARAGGDEIARYRLWMPPEIAAMAIR